MSVSAMIGADLTFSLPQNSVYSITPSKSSGLERVYVIENAAGVTASYRARSSSANVSWSRFSTSGAASATPVAVDRNGDVTSLTLQASDCGYAIEENGRSTYFWIVDYARAPFEPLSLEVDTQESDCMMTALRFDGQCEPLAFYSINGVRSVIDRELYVTYSTLVYDESSAGYVGKQASEAVSTIEGLIRVPAPLCDTRFVISGDRFLTRFDGESATVESGSYSTIAVATETTAEQTVRDNDNESSGDVGGLGGSAPVEITFSAAVTDAVQFTEWQISNTPDFDIIDIRVPQTEFTQVFNDYGTFYVRFMASNGEGSCDAFSQTYDVNVGESKLVCPNAFSPGASEGVNDEWKVSYKSIISFECHIFNRWGVKLAELTDPSQGWDGKHGGKVVPSGVYYYVIKARGADGRNYNLAGDINVINYRQPKTTNQGIEP